MTPEVYHVRTDERSDRSEDKSIQSYHKAIRATYSDLVGRIDWFLNDPSSHTSPFTSTEVRNGTQFKVRESLRVIEKALQDYG